MGVEGSQMGRLRVGEGLQGGKEEAAAHRSSPIHGTPSLFLPISGFGIYKITCQPRVKGSELREPEMECRTREGAGPGPYLLGCPAPS